MYYSNFRHVFTEYRYCCEDLDVIEYTILDNLYHTIPTNAGRMDAIVYLDIDPEMANLRIQKRNRPGEETIPPQLLKDLSSQYEKWLPSLDIPVHRFNANLDLKDIMNEYRLCLNFIDNTQNIV